ncbi:hypothetical protein [Paenibacillus terrigena]|uniref:hypothetical protein n=1 Tax=Paenibacillus terrigena TaxID=369333 RepID=UPI0028D446B4|nr:hypothetical protein [Paenibacillus terrigena]
MLPIGVSVLPVLILGFIMGVDNGIFIVTFNYCLQKETPPHIIGLVGILFGKMLWPAPANRAVAFKSA